MPVVDASVPPPVESEVPPAVCCACCGQTDCPGCSAPDSRAAVSGELEWEVARTLSWSGLWRTAARASREPGRVFATLPEGRLAPALAFAVVAEGLALGSVGVLVFLAAWAWAPALVVGWWVEQEGGLFAAGALLAMVLVMVGLHGLWGLCIELGARGRGHRAQWLRGARFGLYACGWDLITSPIGVVLTLVTQGPRRCGRLLLAALRAPRLALDAYAVDNRGLDEAARRLGRRISVAVLGVLVLLTSLLLVAAVLVAYARWVGYL